MKTLHCIIALLLCAMNVALSAWLFVIDGMFASDSSIIAVRIAVCELILLLVGGTMFFRIVMNDLVIYKDYTEPDVVPVTISQKVWQRNILFFVAVCIVAIVWALMQWSALYIVSRYVYGPSAHAIALGFITYAAIFLFSLSVFHPNKGDPHREYQGI